MPVHPKFCLGRVVAAIFVAELLPILLLVAVVTVYALVADQSQPDSLEPEAFAPIAGNWVGPIGGFLATFLLSFWAARVVPDQAMVHGVAVGIGTAVLDLGLGVLIGGGVLSLLLVLSNCGRIVAGVLGGVLASRARKAVAS